MVRLLATTVVRGTYQGESHGGVDLIDIEKQSVRRVIDWNTVAIDWQGRGWDRGLRGIAFDKERVYIAASDELFAYTPDFKLIDSWRSPFLKHCHEIHAYERTLYLTSTGFDSILGFDLDQHEFNWAMQVAAENYRFKGVRYDPMSDQGPLMLNKLHINNVHCNDNGMYITGLRSDGMLHFDGQHIRMSVELPPGTHNAQPFRDGVLFNDTEANALRYSGRGEGNEDRALAIATYNGKDVRHPDSMAGQIARPGFARGLCVLSDSLVAGGASPATVSVYDLAGNESVLSVNVSKDVRNAIHGLEVWPFD